MAEEAGPSGTGTGKVDAAVLAEAEAKFQQGVQCIRANDLEAAVQLFSEVLQVRTEHYGELAPECASAYYRYGSALLYQAQDSGDVFGASMKEGGEDGEDEEEDEAGDKENGGDKGKAPAAAGAAEGEDEGGEAADADSDLQLAWENLETAKVIWGKTPEANAQQLADVHGLLGEVAMENDNFESAQAELDASLAHLQTFVQEDDRRIAEVQYKRCCALQFGGEVEKALPAVQAACECLVKRQATLQDQLAATAPGEGDDVDTLKAEVGEVGVLLEDLQEKVQELQDLIAQNADTRSMLKGAFAQLAAAGGGGEQPAAATVDGSGGGSSGALEGGSSAGGGGGAVQNLGVVGRGTKRIKLQPVQTNVPAAAGAAAASAEPPAKKKRCLDDLMGGDAGETTFGFGSKPAATAAADSLPKSAPAEAAAPPAVPAFLQASSIKAVYGGVAEQQQE